MSVERASSRRLPSPAPVSLSRSAAPYARQARRILILILLLLLLLLRLYSVKHHKRQSSVLDKSLHLTVRRLDAGDHHVNNFSARKAYLTDDHRDDLMRCTVARFSSKINERYRSRVPNYMCLDH